MINTKELRIGNYVNVNIRGASSPMQETVDSIGDNGINIQWLHEMTDYEYSSENIDPIPLTVEWLEKLGFEKKIDEDGDEYWVNNHVELYYWEFAIEEDNGFYFMSKYEIKIKSVHQLQNVFYFITDGAELQLIK
jgi:hypothetical protein